MFSQRASSTNRYASRFAALACCAFAVLLSACALVPKESVELSTAVGRDIGTVRASHRELAATLFGRMEGDVNRFVDDVYAPYQIQNVLAKQKEAQAKGKDNLFSVLETAMKEPRNAQAQKDAVDVMGAIVQAVHEEVEEYRKIRLLPIQTQRAQVMNDLDRVYDQIERGNATVTAHLASVVKVHELDDQLLEAADLKGLREKIGITLSETSSKVAHFVDNARKVEGSLDQTTTAINGLTQDLDALTKGGT